MREFDRGWNAANEYRRDYRALGNAGAGWRTLGALAMFLSAVPLGIFWLAWNGVALRDGAIGNAIAMVVGLPALSWFAFRRSSQGYRAACAQFDEKWRALSGGTR